MMVKTLYVNNVTNDSKGDKIMFSYADKPVNCYTDTLITC